MSSIQIQVPASTSNLGPGFDCLGIAFCLYNEFLVRRLPADAEGHTAAYDGPEAGELDPGSSDVFFAAAEHLAERICQPLPKLGVHETVNIPPGRGLGGSGTATVAGLVAANHFLEANLSREEILRLAAKLEGHPDNVAPTVLGGLTASVMLRRNRVLTRKWDVHFAVAFVFLCPGYIVPTADARSVLPKAVPFQDAVDNLSRIPLLVHALVTGRLEFLDEIMEDKLHEPYRKPLFRKFEELKKIAMKAGAAGVCISGAGPALVAICYDGRQEKVVKEWEEAAAEMKLGGSVRVLVPDNDGAKMKVLPASGSATTQRIRPK